MSDLKEAVKKVCSFLNKHEVDYILIGGFAVIHYGYPRSTSDLDFWYAPTISNYEKLVDAFEDYGIDVAELKSLVFDPQKTFLRIPSTGFRTEFLPQLKGLESFSEAKKKG